VLGLSLGDYALWSWADANGHQILAFVTNVLLIALLLALAWTTAQAIIRLVLDSIRGASPRRLARLSAVARGPVTARAEDPPLGAPRQAPSAPQLQALEHEMDRRGARTPEARGGRGRWARRRLRRGLAIPAKIAPGGRTRARRGRTPAGASAPPSDRLAA